MHKDRDFPEDTNYECINVGDESQFEPSVKILADIGEPRGVSGGWHLSAISSKALAFIHNESASEKLVGKNGGDD